MREGRGRIFILFLQPVSSPLKRIILPRLRTGVIEDFLEPLQKLKIILILALHQFLHINVLEDVEFSEGLLKNFEIV